MSDAVLETPASTPSLPEIISRYADGESLQTIAKESSVHVRTLYRWMLSGLGDKNYEALVTNCLVNRVADADEALSQGTDVCQIARAREQARFARMDFERRRPHLYGPKMETKTDTTITVIVQRQTPQPVVVEPLTIESAVASSENDSVISE